MRSPSGRGHAQHWPDCQEFLLQRAKRLLMGRLFFDHQPPEAVYFAHGAIAGVDHVPVGA